MKKAISTFITAIFTVPTVLFICLLCAFMSIYISQQKVESLQMSVDNLANYITAIYNAQLEGTKNVVDNNDVRVYIRNPQDPALQAKAASVFYNVFNYNDTVFSSTLYSTDGQILLTTTQDPIGSIQNDGYDFEQVMKTHEPYISLEVAENSPLIEIAYPILENDSVLGIYKRLTPLIYLREYGQTITDYEENVLVIGNNTCLIFKEDTNGAPHMEYIPDLNSYAVKNESALEQIIDKSEDKNSGSINYNSDGSAKIGVFKRMTGMNWLCMISQSRATIFYNLNLFQLVTLLISVVVIVVIYSVMRHFTLNLTKEFSASNGVIQSFLGGDYQRRTHSSPFAVTDNLNQSINTLLDEFTKSKTYSSEMEYRLRTLISTDPVTKLGNNVALYNEIDENFDKTDRQALIMFNLEGFEEIEATFGNSVANRLLEIVAQTLTHMPEENLFSTRLGDDIFCIYISEFDDKYDIDDLANKLYTLLRTIQHVDDLQVELRPHVVLVYKNKSLLGRSDWLGKVSNELQIANQNGTKVEIVDEDSGDDQSIDDIERYENILNNDIEATQGFSRSRKNK